MSERYTGKRRRLLRGLVGQSGVKMGSISFPGCFMIKGSALASQLFYVALKEISEIWQCEVGSSEHLRLVRQYQGAVTRRICPAIRKAHEEALCNLLISCRKKVERSIKRTQKGK